MKREDAFFITGHVWLCGSVVVIGHNPPAAIAMVIAALVHFYIGVRS